MLEIPGRKSDTADAPGWAADPALPPGVEAPVRLEAVGLLAAGLAHDLNTMLGGILATAELMAGRLPAGSDLAGDLDRIAGQCERAGALIRQLLAFSRQETLRPARVEIAEVIGRTAPILRALVGRHIGLSLPSRRCAAVRADAEALERVLLNLVTNARDAIGSRPGLIRIECGRIGADAIPASARAFMPARDYATLSVTDDGPGVPAEHRARIFEPFFTTKPAGQGSGLGLSTAYGLVKQSGGFLLLDAEHPRGARFTVYLPAADARDEGDRPCRTSAPIILLAEDEDLLRACARRGLESAGYSVIAVDGGEAAVSAFAANPGVSALVSDIRMPGLDGVGLARRLREARPGLPVLLVSGYADGAERKALVGLDVAFLPKPYRLADLTASVAALV
jgi:two-component system cell cycle sensor histidine kinase/response regulator CckA